MSSKRKLKVYVRFYASRIKHGLMALDEVPEKYKEAVEEFMKTDEYLMMQIDNKKGYFDNIKRNLYNRKRGNSLSFIAKKGALVNAF